MNLQQTIRNDLTKYIKENNIKKKEAIKVVISEFQRGKIKYLNDNEVIKILKKLENSELELLKLTNTETSDFLEVLRDYLPKEVSEDTIIEYIKNNIDFSQFKNKMQAMRPLTDHFGATVDGNKLKEILLKF